MRRRSTERSAVVVVSVPILDGTGSLVERRIVSLALKELAPGGVVGLARSAQVCEWLGRRLATRLARIQRNRAAVAEMSARVDQAILRHLVEVGWPTELQAGLFDRRAERTFVSARAEVANLEDTAAAQTRHWQAAAELDIGTPSVELIFSWPSWGSGRRQ